MGKSSAPPDSQNNPIYVGEQSDDSSCSSTSAKLANAYRRQLEKNTEFDAPALVDGLVDFVSLVVISSNEREPKYTKFMKIFVLAGLAYFGWKSYDTLLNSDPVTSSEIVVKEGMGEELPVMVLCHETLTKNLDGVQCRYYNYFDEASSFPTCDQALYGCKDVEFDYVDIEVSRDNTVSGAVDTVSQKCIFVDMKGAGLSFEDTAHTMRCHGNLVDNAGRRLQEEENEVGGVNEEEEEEEELSLESLNREIKKLKKQIQEMSAWNSASTRARSENVRENAARKLDGDDAWTYQPNMMIISLYDSTAYTMDNGMKISNSLIDDTMSLVSWSTLYYEDDTGRDSSVAHYLFDTKATTVGHGHLEDQFSVMLRPASFVQTNIYVSYESLLMYLNEIGGCIGLVELVLALVTVGVWLVANVQLRALGKSKEGDEETGGQGLELK
ncbi:hypothetical protein TL16_g03897 [Triparma laevis f. inornata]|uniref:Uncharacterized protein n=1 Tax=Triparma laevis f. inornata TaxID=1714386 RepID=A0A9W7A1F6_9STRA|nr:hypothetical protein TL16_g03897 [Triparma laevis f. inornata]